MKSDLARVPAIAAAAHGTVGEELAFAYPDVLEVISLCTANGIAVLGVEIIVVRPEGFQTEHLSIYDQHMRQGSGVDQGVWSDYVAENNRHADEFVRLHPSGDDHVYVLTTASWAEFRAAEQVRSWRGLPGQKW
jgi:hypothetical protein